MGVGEDFSTFCTNIAVDDRDSIAQRYRLITRRLNLEYWDSDSDTNHSFYLGSYGRGTATGLTSDVDILFRLPDDVYWQYDQHGGNGQSALLQGVRSAIHKTYSVTDVGADGQVVVVPFADGITFEVLPAFTNKAGTYTYPNANGGGSWKTTDPKPEIDAIDARDAECNYNLKYLCRMMRAWKAEWDVPISGLLIDTLAYQFIGTWPYRDKSFLYYDWMSRDFFDFMAGQDDKQTYWLSPGSQQYVWRKGNFEYKATRCRNLAQEAINFDSNNQQWSARQKWCEVYGTSYPD